MTPRCLTTTGVATDPYGQEGQFGVGRGRKVLKVSILDVCLLYYILRVLPVKPLVSCIDTVARSSASCPSSLPATNLYTVSPLHANKFCSQSAFLSPICL